MHTKLLLIAVAVLLLASSAEAQAGKKVTASGSGFYIRKGKDSFKLPGDRRVEQEGSEGYLTTTQSDNPLNLASQNCTGTTITSKDGKTGTGSGYCVLFDAAGDAAWTWFRGDLDAGSWGFIDGTGKFKGIEGGGTWKTTQRSPDGKYINSWDGSWQTK
jgi:hypothetical protein